MVVSVLKSVDSLDLLYTRPYKPPKTQEDLKPKNPGAREPLVSRWEYSLAAYKEYPQKYKEAYSSKHHVFPVVIAIN